MATYTPPEPMKRIITGEEKTNTDGVLSSLFSSMCKPAY